MARHNNTPALPAKPAAAENSGKSRRDHRWFYPVLVELRAIFPHKFPEHVAALTNRHPRVCEDWKAQKGAPDGEALAALLNSKYGDRLELALTRACPHPWRKRLARQIEISQVREQLRDGQARLEALERGEI